MDSPKENGNQKKRGTDQWTVRSMVDPPIRRRSGWGEMFFCRKNISTHPLRAPTGDQPQAFRVGSSGGRERAEFSPRGGNEAERTLRRCLWGKMFLEKPAGRKACGSFLCPKSPGSVICAMKSTTLSELSCYGKAMRVPGGGQIVSGNRCGGMILWVSHKKQKCRLEVSTKKRKTC